MFVSPRCIKQFKGCFIPHISSFPQFHPPKAPQQCLFGPQASSQAQCILSHVVEGKATAYIQLYIPPLFLQLHSSSIPCALWNRGGKTLLLEILNSFHGSKTKLQLYSKALIVGFVWFWFFGLLEIILF